MKIYNNYNLLKNLKNKMNDQKQIIEDLKKYYAKIEYNNKLSDDAKKHFKSKIKYLSVEDEIITILERNDLFFK